MTRLAPILIALLALALAACAGDDAADEPQSLLNTPAASPSPVASTSPSTEAVASTPAPSATPQPTAVPPTPTTAPQPALATAVPTPARANCSPAYPTVCIPPPPPDLDCGDITFRRFTVLPPDPHKLDGSDNDGIGCES